MQQLGKWMIGVGLSVTLCGLVLALLGRAGQFRLPGDLVFRGQNWRVYVPLGTCLLISALMTIVFWIMSLFRR